MVMMEKPVPAHKPDGFLTYGQHLHGHLYRLNRFVLIEISIIFGYAQSFGQPGLPNAKIPG